MMSKLSLLDKLKVLSDVTSSSGLFIVAIVILIALAALLITTNTKTKKISRFVCIAIYGAIIIVSILFYREELFELFDYMMNNFFIAIYFPNLAIYFAAIVTTNIILWISIFNRKITKWIRTINTIIFCFIHYLLILIINIITTNKLDIFDQTSIYENQEALALIELSSTIFVVWILFLIIYKIIRIYQDNQEINPKEELENSPLEKEIRKELPKEPIIKTETIIKRKLPDSIKKTEVPSIIQGNIRKKQPENIIDFMKSATPTQDNSYLMDIPDPILNESPQFLDIMLRDQEIMKPLKSEKQPKTTKIVEKPPRKQRNITVIKEPKLVEKKTLRKEMKKEAEVVKSKQQKELDIFDSLLTLEDYKRVLSVLKTYQQQEKKEIKKEDLEELYRRKR